MRRRTNALAVVVLAAMTLGACSSDDSGSTATTAAPDSTTTTGPAKPLEILVTDDDGIGAPGIDALVTAVAALDDVTVTVVAPAENQSGASDKTTPGGTTYADGATASGVKGTAVAGTPADSVNVALDVLKLTPDVVVSGVNKGQNVGPLTALSGTVGAARTAIRHGVPAVASSAGLDGVPADYEIGARLVADWITEHRDELAAGTASTDAVTSFNVPQCTAGKAKDLIEVTIASAIPGGENPFKTADCGVAVATPPKDDVAGMIGGYLTVTQVPADL